MRSIMKWLIENKELIGLVVSLVVSISLAAYLSVTNPVGFLNDLVWYLIGYLMGDLIWHKVHK